MATGVLIVLIYIWSGESLVALILAIVTLFAIAVIIELKPWAAIDPGTEVFTSMRHDPNMAAGHRSRSSEANHETLPTWRSSYDVTWDARGVSGVAVGKVAPQMWSWSQIDDISQAWYQDDANGGAADPGGADRVEGAEAPLEQIALCLDFPSLRNPEEPEQAPVMFGPNQTPDEVVYKLRSAWRESKVPQSRFYELSPVDRTRHFAEYLGLPTEALQGLQMQSPALLYQELRRVLLADGGLCRVPQNAEFDDVLDRFDRLLRANDVDGLSQDEADELRDADGPDRIAALHWTLDWVAEQRGLRLAFIDQGGTGRSSSGQHDYLIGLIPADVADDWDGQEIGSGSTRVLLDPPQT